MKILNVVPGLVAVCLLASCNTAPDPVSTGKLIGAWPTCWMPGNVQKADLASRQDDWATWRTMKCGQYGDHGALVRVIRCAADVTPIQMDRYFGPVPSDASLPDRICEVEAFEDDGSSGIYYTYFFNIKRSP